MLPTDVIHCIQLQSQSLSAQQSSKVIWALGSIGYTMNTIQLPLQLSSSSSSSSSYLLLEELVMKVNEIKKSQIGNAITASQALTGIAKLGLQWTSSSSSSSQLSNQLKGSIFELVIRICQSNNDRFVANAIWALGSIGVTCDVIEPTMKNLLIDSASRVISESSSWELCNILW